MVRQSYIIAIISITTWLLFPGCKMGIKKETKSDPSQPVKPAGNYYRDVFGNFYLPQGAFIDNTQDSIETGLWEYIKLDTPIVLFGDFSDGLPVKEWQFVLNDGSRFSSNWNIYKNNLTECRFSMPFDYRETIIDSTGFKVATRNDSLGRVSIIVGVGESMLEEEKLTHFSTEVEAGLKQQGYTFTPKRQEIKNSKATYFFTEFFMKDARNNDVKCYHLYGNLPSKSHFVEFTMYHQGPKEDLVKLIFTLVINNLYIGKERFYNPYLK